MKRATQEVDGLVLHHRCKEWCGQRYTKMWMGWYYIKDAQSGVERGRQEVDGLVLTGVLSGVERGTQEVDGLALIVL